jgi:hypothetical protein
MCGQPRPIDRCWVRICRENSPRTFVRTTDTETSLPHDRGTLSLSIPPLLHLCESRNRQFCKLRNHGLLRPLVLRPQKSVSITFNLDVSDGSRDRASGGGDQLAPAQYRKHRATRILLKKTRMAPCRIPPVSRFRHITPARPRRPARHASAHIHQTFAP